MLPDPRLSANHLAALDLPPALRRLYVARDNDAAGIRAADRLHNRHQDIDVVDLVPVHADFNIDLVRLGAGDFRARIADQMVSTDRGRFLPSVRPHDTQS